MNFISKLFNWKKERKIMNDIKIPEVVEGVVEEKVVGREINVNTQMVLGDDNYWTVTETVTHGKKITDDSPWDKRTVSLKVIDRNPDKAYAESIVFMQEYLKAVGFDLFSEKAEAMSPKKPDAVFPASLESVKEGVNDSIVNNPDTLFGDDCN